MSFLRKQESRKRTGFRVKPGMTIFMTHGSSWLYSPFKANANNIWMSRVMPSPGPGIDKWALAKRNSTGRREDFSRIEDAFWVKSLFQSGHESDSGWGEFHLQKRGLGQSYPMLP
jgi:hypothetical protein